MLKFNKGNYLSPRIYLTGFSKKYAAFVSLIATNYVQQEGIVFKLLKHYFSVMPYLWYCLVFRTAIPYNNKFVWLLFFSWLPCPSIKFQFTCILYPLLMDSLQA